MLASLQLQGRHPSRQYVLVLHAPATLTRSWNTDSQPAIVQKTGTDCKCDGADDVNELECMSHLMRLRPHGPPN